MPEELLFEARERTTTATVKEFTPMGVRIAYNFQGQVKGKYDATRIETVEALLRPDGSGEFEGRIVDLTSDGETVMIPLKGSSKLVNSTTMQVQGTESFLTGSRRLNWLNSTQGRFEGTFNPESGEVVIKAFARK